MDPNFRIYSAPEDEIPAEDKARFEGYMKGSAEAASTDRISKIEEKIEELRRRGIE